MRELFHRFARRASYSAGTPAAFFTAVVTVVAWGVTGPIFHFSNRWQLVINTGTTIVTFLMVFVIQYAQNRDMLALHLKLDELIKAAEGAQNRMIDLDKLTDDQLHSLEAHYKNMCVDPPPSHSHTSRKHK